MNMSSIALFLTATVALRIFLQSNDSHGANGEQRLKFHLKPI